MCRKFMAVITISVFVGFLGTALAAGQSDNAAVPILQFTTMAPVTGPYVGTANPIRTIPGGGLAWAISGASGTLFSSGMLKVRTRGLVFAEGPNTGKNTVPYFKAAVSCKTINSLNQADIVNLWTDNFPADSMGDTTINWQFEDFPKPCIAPIVFVTSPTGAWFAVTGK